MALLSRALREHVPERAEARLRELERATSTSIELAAAPGARADDIAIALNQIERETAGGARGAWMVVAGPVSMSTTADNWVASVRTSASRESLQRNVDQLLTPLVKQGLPPEAAAALPALQPLLGILRNTMPGQSPLDLLTSVLSGLETPPKESAIQDATEALKVCFPDRADELLAALKRRMPLFAPPLEAFHESSALPRGATGFTLAETVAALATRIEDRQTGGARYRWTARQRGASLEIVREPLG